MTIAVSVCKNGIVLGTATATEGSNSLASYSGTAPGQGRNVQVTATAGTDISHTVWHRIVTDGGATLTLNSIIDLRN